MSDDRMKQAMKSTAHAVGTEIAGTGGEQATPGVVELNTVENIVARWSDIPQKAARATIEKYGPPNEATPSRLIWFDTRPWKRTIVYRDEVPHNFPKPHTDVLEQFIDYKVPVEKFGEIAAYDGSVIPERTKGEVSARCDMEEMNFLALNLMHDIVTGERTAEEARKEYATQAMAFMLKKPAPYTEGFRFDVARDATADRDRPTIGPMMKEAAGLGKEKAVGGEERPSTS
ncbi:MAG: hypothetical protein ACT4PJ_13785 [Gemmatimonadaceae bacterium]